MAIYRGPGGPGDATADASNAAALADSFADAANASAGQAAASAASALAAKVAAELAETNAETAETNAEAVLTNAGFIAVSTNLQGANTIGTVATNIANVNNTGNNIANVNTVAGVSANITTVAGISANVTTVATNNTNVSTVASNIAAVNTNATNIVAIQNASTNATNAANSATAASTSASTATTQATNASNSASAASASQAAALASQVAAEAAFDAFDDIYLGAKASNPTVDNDGGALTTGDQYFNTVANELRVWNGSSWQTASVVGGTVTNLSVTGNTTIVSGTIDGTTVGASTASTGRFSTLEATGVSTFSAGTVSAPAITTTGDTNTGIFFPAADTIAFTEGGVESMRIDSSGNVGIGTSSPTTKLDVTGTFNASSSATFGGLVRLANNREFQITDSTGTNQNVLFMFTDNSVYLSAPVASSNMIFRGVGYAERMRIDSSGNVGIGTSSPDTRLTVRKTDVDGNIITVQGANGVNGAIGVHAGDNGGVYLQAAATRDLRLRIGTADALTVDSAGNVGIGTTSAGQRLTVATATNFQMRIGDSNAVGVYDIGRNSTSGLFTFFGNQTTFTGYVFSGVDGERMRIDSSGNLLVGTTSSSGTITTKASTANGSTNAFQAQNSANTQLCAIRSDGLFNLGLAANSPYNYTTGSGANAFLNASGELQRSTSSLKYKTDVQNATFGIADVMKLRPVTYKGKSETDGDTIYAGLIAEEVDSVGLKEFVQYAEDGTPDALSYGNMVALAFKAIQEQQALIENLTTRLNALEGK